MTDVRGRPRRRRPAHRGRGRAVQRDRSRRELAEGAKAGLAAHGVAEDAVDVAWVPGAFEIPLVARRMASSGRYDAVVCLGAVIRGETAHFDLVANEAARGIADVARETGVPVIFEVLATDDPGAGGGTRRRRRTGTRGGRRPRRRSRWHGSWMRCPARRSDDDRRQAVGQGGDVLAESAVVGARDHGRAGPGDERPLPPDAGRDVGGARRRSHDRDREPVIEAQPGEEFVIAAEETHRIRNAGAKRGRILEIAYGYTTEDDTQRLEDSYGRSLEPDW